MKSISEPSTRAELATRINALTDQSPAGWGKMTPFQMMKHCSLCDDMMQGRMKLRRVFIGRLIGGMLLKKVLKDETPFGKNAPTAPVLKITGAGDIEQQKKAWISRIEQYADYNEPRFVHPFFGPMTKEQLGFFAYKHADHHLRQFGG
jgi:hypothetical protein